MIFTVTPVFCCSSFSFFHPKGSPGWCKLSIPGESLLFRRRNPEEKNEELSSEEREALQAKAAEVTRIQTDQFYGKKPTAWVSNGFFL